MFCRILKGVMQKKDSVIESVVQLWVEKQVEQWWFLKKMKMKFP